MSDEEHEISYQDHEMLEEIETHKNTNCIIIEKDSEESKLKKKLNKTGGELRHPRQKFCPRWQIEFPWLRPNRVDESVGYCSICKRELVCKKSHLERHQRSFKHMRLQGFENVYTVNEPEAELIEAHTSGYLDNDNDQEFSQVEETFEDVEDGYTTIKVEQTKAIESNPVKVRTKQELNATPKKRIMLKSEMPRHQTQRTSIANVDRDLHYRGIDRERRDMNLSDYFYSSPQQKKDSFDLFFESISATVKTLPPKLAAEVKSRVSQVIAEFELRAICEKEAQEKTQHSMVTIPSQIVTADPTMSTGSNDGGNQQTLGGTAVTHYVYSYQPKKQE